MKKESASIIETRSLGEQVYRHLCNLIIEGRIDYGETLNIKQLAKELNVSSMPIREALKRLEVEGLVVIKPRSMCMLRVPTRKSVLDAIAMRELLEVFCVESVYATVEPERLEALRDIIEPMAELMKEEAFDLKKYIQIRRPVSYRPLRLGVQRLHRPVISRSKSPLKHELSLQHRHLAGYRSHLPRSHRIGGRVGRSLSRRGGIIKSHLSRSRKNVLSGKLFAAQ